LKRQNIGQNFPKRNRVLTFESFIERSRLFRRLRFLVKDR